MNKICLSYHESYFILYRGKTISELTNRIWTVQWKQGDYRVVKRKTTISHFLVENWSLLLVQFYPRWKYGIWPIAFLKGSLCPDADAEIFLKF